MLVRRHGEAAMARCRNKREASEQLAAEYFQRADKGDYAPLYRFGEAMIADTDIEIDRLEIRIKGLVNAITLPTDNRYPDMS